MKKITIVEFEQHDQDFSIWEIDSGGMVISSEPCQGWLWGGRIVPDLSALKVGGFVPILNPKDRTTSEIKYPIKKISTRPAKFAIIKKGETHTEDRYHTRNGGWSKYFDKVRIFIRERDAEDHMKRLSGPREIIQL